jgi:uncharacterized spore protein YtfJ
MKEPEVLETVTPKPPVKPLGTGLFGTRPFDPKEILSEARDAMTVRRVFGEPIEKEGMTIVPVAQVMGGFGAGGPAETPPATTGVTAPAGTKPVTPTGVGGGFGVMARPMGVYVIREGRVRWVPSVDVSRLVFRMILGAAAILFVLRPVLMARVRAKAD